MTTSTPTNPPPPPAPVPASSPPGPLRCVLNKIIAGVIFILPVILTILVIYQLYLILNEWLIEPVAASIIPQGIENPYWRNIEIYVTPVISILAVFVFLYLMGYVFQTRIRRWIDWTLSKVPGIATVYSSIRDVFAALHGPDGLKKINQVVLAPFPHADARMAGYLMGRSRDEATGQSLVCVYIPIALFPPSGYTLIFPEERVTVTTWPAKDVWKLMLSGGLTVPASVPFDSPGKDEGKEGA